MLSIKSNLEYLSILLRHKWYVFIECCKLGIPWLGITHDLSKLSFVEWKPRRTAYEKGYRSYHDSALLTKQEAEELSISWISHYHRNPHHWQWWVSVLDNGELKILPMSDAYRKEMLADWIAVSKIPDRQDVIPWYLENRDKIKLHPETREWIEKQLGLQAI